MTGRRSAAVAFLRTTRPAPAPSTDRATIGWSSIGCIGISTIGRSWASACSVVPWPPCPTTSEARGISSACGTNRCTSALAGHPQLRRVDHRTGGDDHPRVEVGAGVEDRLQALGSSAGTGRCSG